MNTEKHCHDFKHVSGLRCAHPIIAKVVGLIFQNDNGKASEATADLGDFRLYYCGLDGLLWEPKQ